MATKSFPSVFNSEASYESFRAHLAEATPFVRFGALTALTFRRLFGANLAKIPVLSKLNGPIMALVAMHNADVGNSTEGSVDDPIVECDFDSLNDWDLVVAGSGPGGAIAASGSASDGKRVLVVELGSLVDPNVPHHTPEQMRRFFRYGGQEIALNLSPLPYAQGMAWGGGSEINSGLYHRLPKSVMPTWKGALIGVDESDFEAAALEVEDRISVQKQPNNSLGVYSDSPIAKIGTHLGWEGGIIPRWRTYSGRSFDHHGMSGTYLRDAISDGAQVLTQHKVTRYSLTGERVSVEISGTNCKHVVDSAELCLASGVVGTPEILWRSKAAKLKNFTFGFHAMLREAATFDRDVNDLHDIDPHQVWSADSKRKMGAAVGTPQLLSSTLATKNVDYEGPLSQVGTYYISTPFNGKSGFIALGGNLVPYFSVDKQMKRELEDCASILRESLIAVGGRPLGELNTSISTVHVFSSLPLGKTKVLDPNGSVVGSGGRVFVRDASILPSAPLVNPQGPLMHLVTILEKQRRAQR